MENIKAVLFDLDNTLIMRMRTMPKVADTLCRYYFKDRKAEHKFISETFCDCFKCGYDKNSDCYENFVKRVNWENAPEYDVFFAFWNFYYPYCTQPMDDMMESLVAVKNKGYKLGLVTNGPIGMQNAKIDVLGEEFRNIFDVIVITGEVGVHKPDPRPFIRALELLDLKAEDCVYVGDHPRNDIDGARKVGMRTIWHEGYADWEDQYAPADITISGLKELENVL